MDQDSVHMVDASKVPMLRPSVETTIASATAQKKSQKRLELNVRNTLLMGIPNEHQLKFKFIKDAKSLLQAVEKRFGGNVATKKTQRNLLKQQYENFTTSSSEVLHQTFDMLQKLISQLEIHGESISQEDVNKKFLRSLKFSMNDNETIGFDKSKVECYNCHKRGHFARECKASRSQYTKHNESTRRTMPMETPTSAALVSCDALGGNFLPSKPDLSGLEEFVNESIVSKPKVKKPAVETSEAKARADKPKAVRENFGPPLIKDWISYSEDEAESKSKIEKETVKPSFTKKIVKSKDQVISPKKTTIKQGNLQMDLQDKGVIDSGYSRHMTGNMSYLTDYEKINGGYVAFKGNLKGGKITDKGKFDGKADEGFFVGYSLNSKAFRVFNNKTRIVEENLRIRFSENTPNIAGSTKACDDAGKAIMETVPRKDYILLPLWTTNPLIVQESKSSQDDGFQPLSDTGKKVDEDPRQESECKDQKKEDNVNSTNYVNVASTNGVNAVNDDEEVDMNNMDTIIQVSPVATTRIPKDHPLDQDERGIVIRNKARLVAQGDIKEEGINYDEVFAIIAKIKAIRLFLAYASFKDFLVYQMDVKITFLYGKIKEEKFQMSSMGELTFFLRLQVKQKQDGIFIIQDKYVAEILKKYGFSEVKNASTPMETQKPLPKGEDGEEVDVHMYRSMISSLMYLTSSRSDIMFAVCAYVRYQVNPKVSHLHAVKRNFRKSVKISEKKTQREMWKTRKSNLATVKSKTINREGQLQALVDGKKILITESIIRRDLQLEDAEGVDCLLNAVIFEQLTLMGRKVTEVPQPSDPTTVADDAVNKEMNDSLERAATTATSLDAEQDRGRIADIDANEDITLVSTHDEQMFDVDQDLGGEEVFVAQQYTKVVEKEVDAA
uniref:Copia protein n=1 Tax=Tanacetum cinerariifolium TaxID=118510 RepID=A0A6L2M5I5_TANCI|nr:copia protein [Tanacetum cinerariifolium]